MKNNNLYALSVKTPEQDNAQNIKRSETNVIAQHERFHPKIEGNDQLLQQLLSEVSAISAAIARDSKYVSSETFPKHNIEEAFKIYIDVICASELKTKSPSQLSNWLRVKRRAVKNFVFVCGNLQMSAITRKHARTFFDWWTSRVHPNDDSRPLHANSANKDLMNLRSFYTRYWDYLGDEDRKNPFRKLRFRNVIYRNIPAFSDKWLVEKILSPTALRTLNEQARAIVYAMIETGCRPSEILNLKTEHIELQHTIPHLKIRPEPRRELKSRSALRDVPLLGVSLQAMKRYPEGFSRYRGKGNSLSATLNKAFRKQDLFPTCDHRIYSIRHSFESRMLQAGIDYGVRCKLIGHTDNRPQYGNGGSIEFLHRELSKIVFDNVQIEW